MTTQILSLTPFPGAAFRDAFDLDELAEDGHGEVRVLAACAIPYGLMGWATADYPEATAALRAFVLARHLERACFYVEEPARGATPYYPSQRTDVAIGTGDGTTKLFSLPTSKARDEYRDYPILSTLSAKVSGGAVTVLYVSTDARQFYLQNAPGNGAPVTASYRAYRLCRFAPSIDWSDDEGDWRSTQLQIREVMRDPSRKIPAPDLRYATPYTWPKDAPIGTVSPVNVGGPLAVCTIIAGALPVGVAMLFSAGSITGTPTVAGSGSFTVRALGRGGLTSDVVVAWTVTP
jgi:hypothetical protein